MIVADLPGSYSLSAGSDEEIITRDYIASGNADQILVVDKGQIVQRGTHDELIKQDGIYRHFISGREQAVGWKL